MKIINKPPIGLEGEGEIPKHGLLPDNLPVKGVKERIVFFFSEVAGLFRQINSSETVPIT